MECALQVAPERRAARGGGRLVAAVLCAALVGLGALFPARSAAQLDAARALYEQAEFEEALAALVRAEDAGLALTEVVEVLALRAELHLATGDAAAVDRDMVQLVTVAPDHALDARHPPELHEALARARAAATAPLSVALRASPREQSLALDAAVIGDPAGVVRRVEISSRRGEGEWQLVSPPTVVSGAGSVEVAVSAIGPGGAVLATDGTREAPRSFVIAGGSGGDDTGLWIGLGIGAVAVVAAVVVVAVVVSSPTESDRSQPSLPTLAPLLRF